MSSNTGRVEMNRRWPRDEVRLPRWTGPAMSTMIRAIYVTARKSPRSRPAAALKPMRCGTYFWLQSRRTGVRKSDDFTTGAQGRDRLQCDGFKVLAAPFPLNHSACSLIFARKDDLAPPQFAAGVDNVTFTPYWRYPRATIESFSDAFATTSARNSSFQSKSYGARLGARPWSCGRRPSIKPAKQDSPARGPGNDARSRVNTR